MLKSIKGIEKSININFFHGYKILSENNMVSLKWIRRNENEEAHLLARTIFLE